MLNPQRNNNNKNPIQLQPHNCNPHNCPYGTQLLILMAGSMDCLWLLITCLIATLYLGVKKGIEQHHEDGKKHDGFLKLKLSIEFVSSSQPLTKEE